LVADGGCRPRRVDRRRDGWCSPSTNRLLRTPAPRPPPRPVAGRRQRASPGGGGASNGGWPLRGQFHPFQGISTNPEKSRRLLFDCTCRSAGSLPVRAHSVVDTVWPRGPRAAAPKFARTRSHRIPPLRPRPPASPAPRRRTSKREESQPGKKADRARARPAAEAVCYSISCSELQFFLT